MSPRWRTCTPLVTLLGAIVFGAPGAAAGFGSQPVPGLPSKLGMTGQILSDDYTSGDDGGSSTGARSSSNIEMMSPLHRTLKQDGPKAKVKAAHPRWGIINDDVTADDDGGGHGTDGSADRNLVEMLMPPLFRTVKAPHSRTLTATPTLQLKDGVSDSYDDDASLDDNVKTPPPVVVDDMAEADDGQGGGGGGGSSGQNALVRSLEGPPTGTNAVQGPDCIDDWLVGTKATSAPMERLRELGAAGGFHEDDGMITADDFGRDLEGARTTTVSEAGGSRRDVAAGASVGFPTAAPTPEGPDSDDNYVVPHDDYHPDVPPIPHIPSLHKDRSTAAQVDGMGAGTGRAGGSLRYVDVKEPVGATLAAAAATAAPVVQGPDWVGVKGVGGAGAREKAFSGETAELSEKENAARRKRKLPPRHLRGRR
jgi:hypothetical protein